MPLDSLGFPGISSSLLSSGASLLTVHFVDPAHLLVTYSQRGLVPRLEGDPHDHDDRMVAALLVELPSGNVLARTEWHLHDHGRYLWSLGDGRFLLREGDALWTFAPLTNLQLGKPFTRVLFPHRQGSLVAVMVSPDDKLLTVETDIRSSPTLGDLSRSSPVVIDFYRISGTGEGGDSPGSSPVTGTLAGSARAPSALVFPMSADGYLHAKDALKDSRWSVAFEPFHGKAIPLASIQSSCPPGLKLMGPSQYLALSCRGSTDKVTLMAFDFNQHEMWEEPISFVQQPAFLPAPSAGRFAVSRVTSSLSTDPLQNDQSTPMSQEVRIYQTQTGDLLLKVNCSPVIRTAENFDLSSDGTRAVVVHGGAIEVYRLPELSATDRADLAELQKVAPPAGTGPVDLSALAETKSQTAPEDEAAGNLSLDGSSSSTAASAADAVGDTTTRRKPPTLLNPGEKAEFQDKTPR